MTQCRPGPSVAYRRVIPTSRTRHRFRFRLPRLPQHISSRRFRKSRRRRPQGVPRPHRKRRHHRRKSHHRRHRSHHLPFSRRRHRFLMSPRPHHHK